MANEKGGGGEIEASSIRKLYCAFEYLLFTSEAPHQNSCFDGTVMIQ